MSRAIVSENASATIAKKDGEYKVTIRQAGKVVGTYFTDDKQDADATARAELTRIEAEIEADFGPADVIDGRSGLTMAD